MTVNSEELISDAQAARENAFAPFSGFRVGAALLSKDGEIFTGCNVESATYGLTMCAERVAIFKAVSEGVSEFESIAVVTGAQRLTPPCGACRQVIWEMCGNVTVVLANLEGLRETFEMKDLLPEAFDRSFLA
ncbi:MAG: cytidine deaminase [Acidobacteriota bacterium]|nr:MAG: cytidine deaminase [Acidobacteriota bacterium]